MKNDKYIQQFFTGTVISWIFSLIVLALALYSIASGSPGDAGSVLQGTLGVAVAFAGAFVAIKIAAVANKTIQLQMENEQLEEWRVHVKKAMSEFTKVRISFENLYCSAIGVMTIFGNNMQSAIERLKDHPDFKDADPNQKSQILFSMVSNDQMSIERNKELQRCLMDFSEKLDDFRRNSWACIFYDKLNSAKSASVKSHEGDYLYVKFPALLKIASRQTQGALVEAFNSCTKQYQSGIDELFILCNCFGEDSKIKNSNCKDLLTLAKSFEFTQDEFIKACEMIMNKDSFKQIFPDVDKAEPFMHATANSGSYCYSVSIGLSNAAKNLPHGQD